MFYPGDILFGKLRPYLNNNLLATFRGIAVGDFWIFRQGKATTSYVFPFLYTEQYQRVANTSVGSKMPRADWNLVGESKYPVPPNPSEQAAIGDYFRRVDALITEAEREVSRLEKMKQASLQKMFPRPGESVPEVRFADFTQQWKAKKLGELGSTYSGLSGKTREDFGHGNARFITYMNVFTNPIASSSMIEAVEQDQSQTPVKYGDILFTTSSETPDEVGMSSVWKYNIPDMYLNSFCFGYRLSQKVELDYIAYYLRSTVFRSNMKILAQGISRYNISKSQVMELPVQLPSLEEQAAIGEYFRNLDSLIDARRRRVAKLRDIKKACLDKMFAASVP